MGMKAKLIKVLDQYHLYDGDKAIATTIVGNPMLLPNLSKQNCDEIFGVVDVDKWVAEKVDNRFDENDGYHKVVFVEGLVDGFNKAMELSKDKLFTLEEVMFAWDAGVMSRSILGMFSGDLYAKHLKEHRDSYRQSLQQPTEMNVEIVMGDSIGISDLYTPDNKPKLDSSGCIILTKKI